MKTKITLRPYELTDANDIYVAVQESMSELARWLPWCYPGYSYADAVSWIRLTQDGRATGKMYDFGIFDEAGRFAGGCGISNISATERFANLGYWVRSSRAGQGIASSAAREVARWAFVNTSLNRLEILVAVGNTPSERAALTAGAEREGLLRQRLILDGQSRDAHMFSIVRPPCAR